MLGDKKFLWQQLHANSFMEKYLKCVLILFIIILLEVLMILSYIFLETLWKEGRMSKKEIYL